MATKYLSEAMRHYKRPETNDIEQRAVTMEDHVVVQSRTINNRAVFVAFEMDVYAPGGGRDKRTFSRTYTFQDFKSKMPFKMASILLKQNPQEFEIIEAVDKSHSGLAEKIETLNKKIGGITGAKDGKYNCQYCDAKFTSPLQRGLHVKRIHPEEFAKEQATKNKKKK